MSTGGTVCFYVIVYLVSGLTLGFIGGLLPMLSDAFRWVAKLTEILVSIVSFAVFAKMLPITVRRLHDTGKSGWVYAVCLLTTACCFVGSIVLLIFLCQDSMPGSNRYGVNPKGNDGFNGGASGFNGGASGFNGGASGFNGGASGFRSFGSNIEPEGFGYSQQGQGYSQQGQGYSQQGQGYSQQGQGYSQQGQGYNVFDRR